MDESGDLAKQIFELAAENARLRALVDSMARGERLLRPCRVEACRGFWDRVRQERDRSQRHNNFFALLRMECAGPKRTHEVVSSVQQTLRNSDVASVVEKDPVGRDVRREEKDFNIAVLLPHTDRKGAKVATERAGEAVGDVLRRSAMAVYPDDSTDWAKLVRMVTE